MLVDKYFWSRISEVVTFDFDKTQNLFGEISKNLQSSNLKQNSLLFFEKIYELVEKKQIPSEIQETDQKVNHVKEQSQLSSYSVKIPSSSHMTPKEIIYGLSSSDFNRKMNALHKSASVIIDPNFHIVPEFEEILICFLSLNLGELKGHSAEIMRQANESFNKCLMALFIYNPICVLKSI